VHTPEFYNRRKGFEFGRKKGEPKTIDGVKIEHRVGVQAPVEVVWEILHDVAAWPEWNPLYSKVSGLVRIGERLNLTRTLDGRPPEEIQAVVLDWTPNELLHAKRPVMGGLASSVCYWEIDKLENEACVFSNGELFLGFFGKWQGNRERRALRRGYAAMGEALKARAEAQWRASGASPTSVEP
jgi:hypothetical protein